MLKIISSCWPWDHNLLTPEGVIARLKDLGANEVCIRTPEYYVLYHPNYNDKLAQLAREAGMTISIWPIVSLYNPKGMALSIKNAYNHYKPVRIVLDAERKWVLGYINNLEEFLEELGKMPVPVGLGSYRRADLNPGMHWQTWWKAKTSSGKYIIDFNATQLYPIGWRTPAQWVTQMKQDVDSHEAEHIKAGRLNIEWQPWMPAFTQGYFNGSTELWVPPVDSLKASVEYLQTRLGRRLTGFNWWSLDQDMTIPQLSAVYKFVKELSSATSPVPPILPELTHDQRVEVLWREAKKHPEIFNLEI